METTEGLLKIILARWEPDKRRTCANCLHAIVYGAADSPMVRCEMAKADLMIADIPIPLAAVSRTKAPHGFVPQGKCLWFERS